MNNSLIVGEIDAIRTTLETTLQQVSEQLMQLRKNIAGNPIVKAEDVPSIMEKDAEQMKNNGNVKKDVPAKSHHYTIEFEKAGKKLSEVFQSAVPPGENVGKLTQEVLDYLKPKGVKNFTRISTVNGEEIPGTLIQSITPSVKAVDNIEIPKKKSIIKNDNESKHGYTIEYNDDGVKKTIKFKSAYNIEKDASKIQRRAKHVLKCKGIVAKSFEVFLNE